MSTGAPTGKMHPIGNGLYAFHHEFVYGDADTTVNIPVEEGTLVHRVGVVVETAFTANGTHAELLIGVTGDTDAFMTAAHTALDSAGDGSGTEPKIAQGDNTNGYYFKAASNIVLTFTKDTGTPTEGRCIVFGIVSNVLNSGIVPA